MEESQKIVRTAIVILILLIAGFGIYYLFISDRGKAPVSSDAAPAEKIGRAENAAEGSGGSTPVNVALDQTDDVLRKSAVELSSNPVFAQWLKSKDLIRRFAAAVDAIANGQSPRPQADFFALKTPFPVLTRGGRIYLDPAGYDRYNVVADVFDSVSAAGCAKLYRDYQAPIEQAYRELGYPAGGFHQTLFRAILEVLRTPVVETPIVLDKRVASYVLNDPKLEELSAAQKHLLRMGPENLQLVQGKLRELALALGFAETQLPKIGRAAAPAK
jgi:hypothetical protein